MEFELKNIEVAEVESIKKTGFSKSLNQKVSLIDLKINNESDYTIQSLSIYSFLKSRDKGSFLPDYNGVSHDSGYLLCEELTPLSSQGSDVDIKKMLKGLIQSLVFLHTNGWSGVDLSIDNVAYSENDQVYKLLNMASLKPLNVITNKNSYYDLMEDYRVCLAFVNSFLSMGSQDQEIELMELLEKVGIAKYTEFYGSLNCLCDALEINFADLFESPFYSPMIDRDHQDLEIGKNSFSFVKGYSGVGKTSLLSMFLNSDRSSRVNTIVISSKETRYLSALDDFTLAFDNWLSWVMSSNNPSVSQLLNELVYKQDDLLCSVFPSLSNLKSQLNTNEDKSLEEIGSANKRIEGRVFKYQLLNLIKRIRKALNNDIYLVFDNFNSADKFTLDFLEFYINGNQDSGIKCIVFYKEFTPDEYQRPFELLSQIESSPTIVEKLTIPAFSQKEVEEYITLLLPKFRRKDIEVSGFTSLSKGNPLFLKTLVLKQELSKEAKEGDFLNLFNRLMGELFKNEKESNIARDLLNILSTYAKPVDANALYKLSGVVNSDEFDFVILTLLSSGVVSLRNENIWFSHDKYSELVRQGLTNKTKLSLNHKIATHLMDSNSDWVKESTKILDIAHHSCEAHDMINSALGRSKLTSVCFAAAIKCREIGAYEEALYFIEKAVRSIATSKSSNFSVDEQFSYMVDLEYSFLLKENGRKDDAYDSFSKLLGSTSSEREKLEIELELIRIAAKGKDYSKFTANINKVFKRYMFPDVTIPEKLELMQVVNSINQNLLGRSLSKLKTGNYISDEKENKFREILSFLANHYLYRDHRLVTWIGLAILDRSLKLGQSPHTASGVVVYAHYLNSQLKDFSGSQGFKDLAAEMLKERTDGEFDRAMILKEALLSTLQTDYVAFKKDNDVAIRESLAKDYRYNFEHFAVTGLLFDFCYSERPSYLKDRLFILQKITQKNGKIGQILDSVLIMLSNHVDLMSGKKSKYIPYKGNVPFLINLDRILKLKTDFLSGRSEEYSQENEIDEKSEIGGLPIESEYLYWSFLNHTKKSYENNRSLRASSPYCRRLALLSRNSIETLHVANIKIKISYLIDSYISNKHSSSAIKEISDQVKLNGDQFSNLEKAVVFEFVSSFYYETRFTSDATSFLSRAVELAKESGYEIYQNTLEAIQVNPKNRDKKEKRTVSGKDWVPDKFTADVSLEEAKTKYVEGKIDEMLSRNKHDNQLVSDKRYNQELSQVDISKEKLFKVRQELVKHLFELDSKLLDNTERPGELLERFFETSRLYFLLTENQFEAKHHGNNLDDQSGIAEKLVGVFDLYEEFNAYENISVCLETIVDDIYGTGNLIVIIRADVKNLSFDDKEILSNAVSALKPDFNLSKSKIDSDDTLIFEFQINLTSNSKKASIKKTS